MYKINDKDYINNVMEDYYTTKQIILAVLVIIAGLTTAILWRIL